MEVRPMLVPVAEQLRELALKCAQLARDYRGDKASVDFEGLAVELAEVASRLDRFIELRDEP
jgi:hypothetical protein